MHTPYSNLNVIRNERARCKKWSKQETKKTLHVDTPTLFRFSSRVEKSEIVLNLKVQRGVREADNILKRYLDRRHYQRSGLFNTMCAICWTKIHVAGLVAKAVARRGLARRPNVKGDDATQGWQRRHSDVSRAQLAIAI